MKVALRGLTVMEAAWWWGAGNRASHDNIVEPTISRAPGWECYSSCLVAPGSGRLFLRHVCS